MFKSSSGTARKWLEKILKFLELPWTEDVMHHEKQINKPHGISLSKVERSSDQVKLIEFQLSRKIPSQVTFNLEY